MDGRKPRYLYHGSQYLTDTLEPCPARGVGPQEDRLYAIYASHVRNFAIPFALPMNPDDKGNTSWSMSFHRQCPDLEGDTSAEGEPRMTVKAGHVDLSRVGYLYRVPSDSFEKIDEHQWVSYISVKPVDHEIIYPSDYIRWVRSSAVKKSPIKCKFYTLSLGLLKNNS